MSNRARLAKLEQMKPSIKYPSFGDMYSTQTKETYMAWMLANNPRSTRQDILDRNILHFEDLYDE